MSDARLVFTKSVSTPDPPPPKPEEIWRAEHDGWQIEVNVPTAPSGRGRIHLHDPARGNFFFYPPLDAALLPVTDGLEAVLATILGTLRDASVDLSGRGPR